MRRNYKWNISKEEGIQIINDKIKEILLDSNNKMLFFILPKTYKGVKSSIGTLVLDIDGNLYEIPNERDSNFLDCSSYNFIWIFYILGNNIY